jgi:hypothetical protein
VYGNRGCLHDAGGRIRRRFSGKRWIACRLQFKNWHREPLQQPGRFTELFFLDEVTAFAAGHRPCALCRRADYERLLAVCSASGADAIDARLHCERLDTQRAQRRHEAPLDELPDGAFIVCDDEPWLVLGTELLQWTPAGYRARTERPTGLEALVLTPPSLVAVLRAGWQPLVPLLHPSA